VHVNILNLVVISSHSLDGVGGLNRSCWYTYSRAYTVQLCLCSYV